MWNLCQGFILKVKVQTLFKRVLKIFILYWLLLCLIHALISFYIPAIPDVSVASALLSFSFLSLSLTFFFNLLSSPPPFHCSCKAFIHMPAIPDCCIPVNRTSVAASTSACRFCAQPAASLSSLPLSHQRNSLSTASPREQSEPVEMLVCYFLVSGALFLANSRWRHRPIFISHDSDQHFTSSGAFKTMQWCTVQTISPFFLGCYIWFERQIDDEAITITKRKSQI